MKDQRFGPGDTQARRELRLEKADTVRRMRDNGVPVATIAETTGVGVKYVYELLDDPDGSKTRARKRRYYESRAKPCVDCGGRTSGEKPSVTGRCWDCQVKATTVWPREAMIAAAHEWHDVFGNPPTAVDWIGAPSLLAKSPGSRLRREDAKDAGLRWPATSLVQTRFGSWNAFIAACGWEPMPVGHKYSERSAA